MSDRRVEKSEEAWRAQLSPDAYWVTRKGGTERPFTGAYWNSFEAGAYHCICCDARLFDATSKFASHCGWPSFDDPADGEAIEYVEDRSHGMLRTEVRCRACGAHLGHVFPDGPTETGLRYCINSVALRQHGEGGES